MELIELLQGAVDQQASDIFILSSLPLSYKLNGVIIPQEEEKVTPQSARAIIEEIYDTAGRPMDRLLKSGDDDFSLAISGLSRFRVSTYKQRGSLAAVIRLVSFDIPNYKDLSIPESVMSVADKTKGLVLVTGPAGGGKSTTLACIIDRINNTRNGHIITLEEPLEYLHRNNKCVISQREIGVDTLSYANALRAALRQDPDVLLVGEIRDLETMQIALTAADTGHMVFATIHTTNATETIQRVLSMYPPHQHDEIRILLSEVLAGIISLRLLPTADGAGRVPAAEVLVNTAAIKEYIRDKDKLDMVEHAIAEGHMQYRSQTFDQALLELYRDGRITIETAMNAATNKDDFDLKIRGISGTSDRGWM